MNYSTPVCASLISLAALDVRLAHPADDFLIQPRMMDAGAGAHPSYL